MIVIVPSQLSVHAGDLFRYAAWKQIRMSAVVAIAVLAEHYCPGLFA